MATRLLGHAPATAGELCREMAICAGESVSRRVGDTNGGLAISGDVECSPLVKKSGLATCQPSLLFDFRDRNMRSLPDERHGREGRRVAVPDFKPSPRPSAE